MATRAVFDMGWKSHIITLVGAVGFRRTCFPVGRIAAVARGEPKIP